MTICALGAHVYTPQLNLLNQALSICRDYGLTWMRPASQAMLFTDTACTLPAIQTGGVGVSVAGMKDSLGGAAIATQSTAGWQPKLYRGAVNWCTNNNHSPVSGGYLKGGDAAAVVTIVNDSSALIAAGLTDPNFSGMVYKLDNSSGVTSAYIQFSGTSGSTAAFVSSSYIRVTAGSAGVELGGVAGVYGFTNSAYQRKYATGSGSASATAVVVAQVGSVVYVIGNQLEVGSTPSSLAFTTSAPASNGIGPSALWFDGAQTRMGLGAVPFQMADDQVVIAGTILTAATAGVQDIFSQRGATGTPIVAELNIDASKQPVCTWRDDANNLTKLTATGYPVTLGSAFVTTGSKIGSALAVRLNGSQVASTSNAFGATTLTGSSIGAYTQSPANFFNGPIYGLIFGKLTKTLPASKLRILEKAIAIDMAQGSLVP